MVEANKFGVLVALCLYLWVIQVSSGAELDCNLCRDRGHMIDGCDTGCDVDLLKEDELESNITGILPREIFQKKYRLKFGLIHKKLCGGCDDPQRTCPHCNCHWFCSNRPDSGQIDQAEVDRRNEALKKEIKKMKKELRERKKQLARARKEKEDALRAKKAAELAREAAIRARKAAEKETKRIQELIDRIKNLPPVSSKLPPYCTPLVEFHCCGWLAHEDCADEKLQECCELFPQFQ